MPLIGSASAGRPQKTSQIPGPSKSPSFSHMVPSRLAVLAGRPGSSSSASLQPLQGRNPIQLSPRPSTSSSQLTSTTGSTCTPSSTPTISTPLAARRSSNKLATLRLLFRPDSHKAPSAVLPDPPQSAGLPPGYSASPYQPPSRASSIPKPPSASLAHLHHPQHPHSLSCRPVPETTNNARLGEKWERPTLYSELGAIRSLGLASRPHRRPLAPSSSPPRFLDPFSVQATLPSAYIPPQSDQSTPSSDTNHNLCSPINHSQLHAIPRPTYSISSSTSTQEPYEQPNRERSLSPTSSNALDLTQQFPLPPARPSLISPQPPSFGSPNTTPRPSAELFNPNLPPQIPLPPLPTTSPRQPIEPPDLSFLMIHSFISSIREPSSSSMLPQPPYTMTSSLHSPVHAHSPTITSSTLSSYNISASSTSTSLFSAASSADSMTTSHHSSSQQQQQSSSSTDSPRIKEPSNQTAPIRARQPVLLAKSQLVLPTTRTVSGTSSLTITPTPEWSDQDDTNNTKQDSTTDFELSQITYNNISEILEEDNDGDQADGTTSEIDLNEPLEDLAIRLGYRAEDQDIYEMESDADFSSDVEQLIDQELSQEDEEDQHHAAQEELEVEDMLTMAMEEEEYGVFSLINDEFTNDHPSNGNSLMDPEPINSMRFNPNPKTPIKKSDQIKSSPLTCQSALPRTIPRRKLTNHSSHGSIRATTFNQGLRYRPSQVILNDISSSDEEEFDLTLDHRAQRQEQALRIDTRANERMNSVGSTLSDLSFLNSPLSAGGNSSRRTTPDPAVLLRLAKCEVPVELKQISNCDEHSQSKIAEQPRSNKPSSRLSCPGEEEEEEEEADGITRRQDERSAEEVKGIVRGNTNQSSEEECIKYLNRNKRKKGLRPLMLVQVNEQRLKRKDGNEIESYDASNEEPNRISSGSFGGRPFSGSGWTGLRYR